MKKKGQIAVLIALSFSFLFLLFAMLVNIGFLLVAKINLQNSVDLAAYAGAAQQARYLTEIGKWNYEMRRNYKAFVYDYQIAFNAERNDFEDYIKQEPNQNPPIVCCTLQKRFSAASSSKSSFCQFDNVADFTEQEKAAAAYESSSLSAWITLIPAMGTPGGAAAMGAAIKNWISSTILKQKATLLKETYNVSFANYVYDTNRPNVTKYNYNLRLLGWTVHDYRHIQARIRGVHTGLLNIENRLINPLNLNGDSTPVIFNNAPISVAAKVINGYTELENAPNNISGTVINLKTENNDEQIKNPVHNAAYYSFKRNLLKITANGNAQLFHLVPKYQSPADSPNNNMGTGCEANGGSCMEYNGPYLRLLEHNVTFKYQIKAISHEHTGNYFKEISPPGFITNFPVGVAKDVRIKTYYALIAAARVTDIPFNVFFGNNEFSQNPALVAVAAARPFGSRIGPYVNSACSDISDMSQRESCIENGLDPLYPAMVANNNKLLIPNFSILKQNDKKGVKYTVGQDEYKRIGNPLRTFANTYYDTKHTAGRWRLYAEPNPSGSVATRDDGFDTLGINANFYTLDPLSDEKFYDNDSKNIRIHPHGCRNSIMAWNDNTTKNPRASNVTDVNQLNHYERYLSYLTTGIKGAVVKLPPQDNRTRNVNGQDMPYNVYVFKYPNLANNNWDIEKKTKGSGGGRPDGHFMEKSFANTMAVNEFEINRYIVPHSNTPTNNFLNWITENNSEGFVFAGNPLHIASDSANFGNKAIFDENQGYAKYENDDALSPNKDNIPESYSSWRIGLRGYRVKLSNIQDYIQENENFKNPIDAEQTIYYQGENGEEAIRINLNEIKY